jgi:hypothetical protein
MEAGWLTSAENAFLRDDKTPAEASVLSIAPDGVTIVGKAKWGMLYGVQTVCQLVTDALAHGREFVPCLSIRDWPDLPWRCLAPTLAWYSGWNRLEGYDLCNWSGDEWKWLADWSLLHKCNAWAVCMYGTSPLRHRLLFPRPGPHRADVEVGLVGPAATRPGSRSQRAGRVRLHRPPSRCPAPRPPRPRREGPCL